MSYSHRRDRGALVALGLALVSIVAICAIQTWAGDPVNAQVRQPNTEQTAGRHDQPIVTTGFWETYTAPKDSYAQWIMAFFTIAATGVSIWAVRLVRDTLVTNREMNAIARQSQRAWIGVDLTIDAITVSDQQLSFPVNIIVKNFGSMPAFSINSDLESTFDLEKVPEIIARLAEQGKIANRDGRFLVPQESYRRYQAFSASIDDLKPNAVYTSRVYPIVCGCVTYRTPSDESIHQTGFSFLISQGSIGVSIIEDTEQFEITGDIGGFAT
ncbi:MAG: hypothetical protein M9944_06940 [Rhizobiaceae bacterium]|nr:hypothetical protein [Rhizobiaceae bacterium]